MFVNIFKLLIRYKLIEEKDIYTLSFVNKELNKQYKKYRKSISPIYDIHDDIRNIIKKSKIITFNKYYKYIKIYVLSHMYCFYEIMEEAKHKYIIYSYCKWIFENQDKILDNSTNNYLSKLLYYGIKNPKLIYSLFEIIFFLSSNILNEDNVISTSIKSSFVTIFCYPELFDICIINCIHHVKFLYEYDDTYLYMTDYILKKLFDFMSDVKFLQYDYKVMNGYINGVLGLAIKMGNIDIINTCCSLIDKINISFSKEEYDNFNSIVKSSINQYIIFNRQENGNYINRIEGFINIECRIHSSCSYDDMNEFNSFKDKYNNVDFYRSWFHKTKNPDIKYEIYNLFPDYFANSISSTLNDRFVSSLCYEPTDIKCFNIFERSFSSEDYLKIMDLYIVSTVENIEDVSFDLFEYIFHIILNQKFNNKTLNKHIKKWILYLLRSGTAREKYRYHVLHSLKILDHIISKFKVTQLNKIIIDLNIYACIFNIESINYLINKDFKFNYEHIIMIYKDIGHEFYKIPKYIKDILQKLKSNVGVFY